MKAPEAFRGISEVADAIGVRQHTLRAWETRFHFVRPVKRSDGRRYYRPADVVMLRELKRLIDDEKLSVDDIVKINRDGGLKLTAARPEIRHSAVGATGRVVSLESTLEDLRAAKSRLVAVLGLSAAAAD